MDTLNNNRQRALILFAHPYPHSSKINRRLLDRIREVDGVEVNDLYENYPDFHINVAREHEQLTRADLIIFQHPLYWYSAPALLKQWQDVVLDDGFAFGRRGDALRGKRLMSVITTGHSERAYRPGGYDQHTIGEYLWPYEQTAFRCKMEYLKPLVFYCTQQLSPEEIEGCADTYQQLIEQLLRGPDG